MDSQPTFRFVKVGNGRLALYHRPRRTDFPLLHQMGCTHIVTLLKESEGAQRYGDMARTPGIESFILHAHDDNRDEFGLNLGIWRRDKSSPLPSAPGSPKPIYAVFKGIDGPQREEILAQAREVVGEENWKAPEVSHAGDKEKNADEHRAAWVLEGESRL